MRQSWVLCAGLAFGLFISISTQAHAIIDTHATTPALTDPYTLLIGEGQMGGLDLHIPDLPSRPTPMQRLFTFPNLAIAALGGTWMLLMRRRMARGPAAAD